VGTGILCIDDDRLFCEAIATVLRDAGYAVRTANTVGDGLPLLSGVDLAIVDLNLSGLPGDALVRAIREVRSMPVILTSGAPAAEGRAIARACGAQHFLAKPFDLDELLRVVRTLLAEAHAALAARN
jgi:DNA-binding response OmpR family regulator